MTSRMSISHTLNPAPMSLKHTLNKEPLSLGLHDKTPNIGDPFSHLNQTLDGSRLVQSTHRRSPYGPDFPYRNIHYDDMDGLLYRWFTPESEMTPEPHSVQWIEHAGYMSQPAQQAQHYLRPEEDPSNPYSPLYVDNNAPYRPNSAPVNSAYADSSYYSASQPSKSADSNTKS
jgi:hypothetical protein